MDISDDESVSLNLSYNSLYHLPKIDDNIKILNVSENNISKIKYLPSELEEFYCNNNILTEILTPIKPAAADWPLASVFPATFSPQNSHRMASGERGAPHPLQSTCAITLTPSRCQNGFH